MKRAKKLLPFFALAAFASLLFFGAERARSASSFQFSLAVSPTSARVDPKPGTTLTDITVRMTQLDAGQVNLKIENETENYALPAGITASFTNNSCTPAPNVVGATCPTAPRLTLSVAASAIDGVYNIPIFGKSGPAKVVVYFTLKVGPLNLTPYRSLNFLTDPHRRPAPQFTWSPLAPFAGDTVMFDAAASRVWGGGSMTGANTGNSVFRWSFTGTNTATPSVAALTSGMMLSPTLTLEEPGLPTCYTKTATSASATEICACATSTDYLLGGGITVSKPRPFFREIKP